MEELITCDVLIIGSGIAGATAALESSRTGHKVVLVTKNNKPEESNTFYAQGGVIYKGLNDSPKSLAKDIMEAGAYLSNPRAVEILTTEGPGLVKKLLIENAEVEFDKSNGSLALAKEGGHSIPRIIHNADATGKSIETALIEKIRNNKKIKLITNLTAIDLISSSHQLTDKLKIYNPITCLGAYFYDTEKQKVNRILSRFTILATGGLGSVFLYTTNPEGASGDGIAMAVRAGARAINMEYVQFHPTAFYHKDAPRFLLTEAIRGEGARLTNLDGIPFMDRYSKKWKDLAPRDVVARAIYTEMLKNGKSNVYLDLKSYIPKERILTHFPNLYKECLKYGVDLTHDLIPVVPAAHYHCGGLWVDENGATTVKNLYAVGEVSCTGLHGANRLASTSLLEGLTWGYRAAQNINLNEAPQPNGRGIFSQASSGVKSLRSETSSLSPTSLRSGYFAKGDRNTEIPDSSTVPQWINLGKGEPDSALIIQDTNLVREIMWNSVGLVRTKERLERAKVDLSYLNHRIEKFYQEKSLTEGLMRLRNIALVASLITNAAWENKISAGCHYRTD